MDANELGAREAAGFIARGDLSAAELTAACLARIEAREPAVRAWAHLDPELALASARRLDQGSARGPLHGVPVGVKDIIDTADMPTANGSPIYAGRRPERDAPAVARLRAAGAVILGKTVTTEFAYRHPFGETRNPHDEAHTPGGSSSGSAAAVADRMVPLALGTQTGGSIIRPASFCGVFGHKPTYETFDFTGIKPCAPGLDTLGTFARSVDDLAWIAGALAPALGSEVRHPDAPPRIAVARMPEWGKAEPASVEAVEAAAQVLAEAGAEVATVGASAWIESLSAAHTTVMEHEAARALDVEFRTHRSQLSDELQAILTRARAIPTASYDAAMDLTRACRGRVDELFAGADVLLTASATGEAPPGLAFTGNHVFNRVWTLLHLPCITIPAHHGPNGLPVGIQLVARHGDDPRLLGVAGWVARRLLA